MNNESSLFVVIIVNYAKMAKTDFAAKIVFAHIRSFLRLLRISKHFSFKVLLEHFSYLLDTSQWSRKVAAFLLVGIYCLNVYTRKKKTRFRIAQNLKSKQFIKRYNSKKSKKILTNRFFFCKNTNLVMSDKNYE